MSSARVHLRERPDPERNTVGTAACPEGAGNRDRFEFPDAKTLTGLKSLWFGGASGPISRLKCLQVNQARTKTSRSPLRQSGTACLNNFARLWTMWRSTWPILPMRKRLRPCASVTATICSGCITAPDCLREAYGTLSGYRTGSNLYRIPILDYANRNRQPTERVIRHGSSTRSATISVFPTQIWPGSRLAHKSCARQPSPLQIARSRRAIACRRPRLLKNVIESLIHPGPGPA